MTLVPAVLALLGDRAWWLPRGLDRRLPSLDVEGADLARHVEHEEWTAEHGPAAVRADGLRLPGTDLAAVDLALPAGSLLAVSGTDRVARRSLLAALTGRLDVEGRLVVLDRVLPGEAAAVRRRCTLLERFPTREELARLGGADGPAVVAVDDLDLFASEDEVDARWAALRRPRRRRHDRAGRLPWRRPARRRRPRPRQPVGRADLAGRACRDHHPPHRRGEPMTRHLTRVLAGTLLLPTVFGALVVWSLSDRAERSESVPAAVVNLDKPVTQGHGKDKQVVYAGRLLAAGLTSPEHEPTAGLGWQLTDAADAQQGLADGDYYAVVTIPRGFSRTLAGISTDPRRAQVSVQSNDSSSALAGEVGHQVTDVALARLGHTVTATYLEGVLSKTGELRGSLGDAASGAGRLADGAGRLQAGADRLDRGAGDLATGLGTLSGGAADLSSGADRLHDGTGRLAGGAGRLASGADRLAGGLGTLSDRTDPLPGQTRDLADGAQQVSDGVGPYSRLVKAWAQSCATDPVLAAGHAQLCAATLQAAGPAGSNADRLAAGARGVASGADRLADATPRLASAVDRASTGADRLASGAHDLTAGTRRLDTGAARLASGAGRLADGARQAGDGATALADGSSRLASGSGDLADGGGRLATGLRDGADRIPAVDDAGHQAKVVADPVAARSTTLEPADNGSTLLAPAVLALALWLGAFVTFLVRPALPRRLLRAAVPAWRVTVGGWLPAVAIGVGQAALLLGAVLALGADPVSPFGLVGVLALAALVFAAVNQAFVALLGPGRGWIASIGFAVLQVVSLGGLVPIATAPGPLQVLNDVLPVSRAADVLGRLTLGGATGSPAADLVVLALWGVAALAVTTLAARRRSRLTVSDVRRQVEEPLPVS